MNHLVKRKGMSMDFLLKIRTRYLFLITLLLFLFLSLSTIAKPAAPDISEVLMRDSGAMSWQIFTMGLFALSLATLSFAKGYEILKRRQAIQGSGDIEIIQEENSRLLNFNRKLERENEDVKKRIAAIESAQKEKDQEHQRIAGEKERLAVEVKRLCQREILSPLKLEPPRIMPARPVVREVKKPVKVAKKSVKLNAKRAVKKKKVKK
jgi:hypothetical protein